MPGKGTLFVRELRDNSVMPIHFSSPNPTHVIRANQVQVLDVCREEGLQRSA